MFAEWIYDWNNLSIRYLLSISCVPRNMLDLKDAEWIRHNPSLKELERIVETVSSNTSKNCEKSLSVPLSRRGRKMDKMSWDHSAPRFFIYLSVPRVVFIHGVWMWDDWADFLSTTCQDEPEECCPVKWAPREARSSCQFSYSSAGPLSGKCPWRKLEAA